MDTEMVQERARLFKEIVYAHGVTALLTCLELKTGKVVWKRNLRKSLISLKILVGFESLTRVIAWFLTDP